ncbi:Uncharacterised protein [Chlamydia abortus]|nr:Uncharacterised protein [Chlamydia abortus]
MQTEREPQISVQAALMKFIEDDQPHILQRGIFLEKAGQNPFRYNLYPRLRAYPRIQSDPIPYRPAHRLSKSGRHILCSRPGSQAARFQHENTAPLEPRLVQ